MPFAFCPNCPWTINESGGDDYARAVDYLALHRWYVHHTGDDTIRSNSRLCHWVGRRDDLEQLIDDDPDTARKVLGQFVRQEADR
jgi:hypothetical protein